MATKKKLLQAAAGQAGGGAALNVEDVFSTYLYEGTGSAQTITNGIDLDGEGGLVWIKNRENVSGPHYLHDSEMSSDINYLQSNSNSGLLSGAAISKNSNGFSIASTSWEGLNASGEDYASWTFRKAPKFFDVVTYTGTGSAQTIAHNLDATVGTLIVKRTDATSDWATFHRSEGESKVLYLNYTSASQTDSTQWNNTAPTSTQFTVGTSNDVNASGGTYVAYLFANNNGDGDFGPDGDADIIKCGSYTGANTYKKITLGFEPQMVIVKAVSGTYAGDAGWRMFDNMRNGPWFYANTSAAETGSSTSNDTITYEADGFSFDNDQSEINRTGYNYIYIAIRRGTKVPESATEVFDVQSGRNSGTPSYTSGFPVDLTMVQSDLGGNWNQVTRLQGGQHYLYSNSTDVESNDSDVNQYAMDIMNGIGRDKTVYTPSIAWMWKRAPGFFDVVAYTGNGTAGRTVSHNLGVAPEMMWVKRRDSAANWYVYQQYMDPSPADRFIWLNLTDPKQNFNTALVWNNTLPTVTDFSLGSGAGTNGSGGTYIAYLFASLDGISKVGSYTGNGSSQTIDCGFTSGARFVLIKRTDSTSDWWVFDTERGIVTGNDSLLSLNGNAAEDTSYDNIDPDSSGFIINNTAWNENASGGSYIFYAIA